MACKIFDTQISNAFKKKAYLMGYAPEGQINCSINKNSKDKNIKSTCRIIKRFIIKL